MSEKEIQVFHSGTDSVYGHGYQIYGNHPLSPVAVWMGFEDHYWVMDQEVDTYANKRLSHSEAAAEYFCEWAEYLYWFGKRHPDSLTRAEQERRVKILERFALLPHYDEGD